MCENCKELGNGCNNRDIIISKLERNINVLYGLARQHYSKEAIKQVIQTIGYPNVTGTTVI